MIYVPSENFFFCLLIQDIKQFYELAAPKLICKKLGNNGNIEGNAENKILEHLSLSLLVNGPLRLCDFSKRISSKSNTTRGAKVPSTYALALLISCTNTSLNNLKRKDEKYIKQIIKILAL